MHADCRTSCPRCTMVEATDLGGMVEFAVNPHTVVSGWKPRLRRPTGGYQNYLAGLGGSKFLNDLVQQRETEETCTSTVPAKVVIVHPPPVELGELNVVDCGRHVHCWKLC